jgi:hypothetical protein
VGGGGAGAAHARRARDGPARRRARLAGDFDARLEDRPLGGDATLAEAALPSLAELVRAAS